MGADCKIYTWIYAGHYDGRREAANSSPTIWLHVSKTWAEKTGQNFRGDAPGQRHQQGQG